MEVIFCEKLRLIDLMFYGLRGRQVFYGSRSLFAHFGLKIFSSSDLAANITNIDLGHVHSIKGIRKNAYKNAEKCVESLDCREWANRLVDDLGFDFWLFVKKYFFNKFYLSFQFFELAFRFAQENPDKDITLSVSKYGAIGFYKEELGRIFKVTFQFDWSFFKFLASLMVLPLVAIAFGVLNRQKDEHHFEKQIICEVDGIQTFEIFRSLFSDIPHEQLAFVTERRHSAAFDDSKGVYVLGLCAKGQKDIIYAALLIGLRSVSCLPQLSIFGSDLFYLFYDYIRGKAGTVTGSGNVYCVFEHLFNPKSVRNELLRSSGNCSVFVPLNTYVTNEHWQYEYMINYDVVLSAGKHFEDLYPRKRAKTQIYLPTGSYASHRMSIRDDGWTKRQVNLNNFKGDDVLILVVSPGICQPTLNIELELMALLEDLSHLNGVKIILRLKPVEPLPIFKDFYQSHLDVKGNVLVTAGEYDLFDFVGVADLVVTSISTAAYDLAQVGSPTMFVDYFDDAVDTEYLPAWLQSQGFPLAKHHARDFIVDWVEDNGCAREKWTQNMAKFADYFAYRHPNFEAYRKCVQSHVQKVARDAFSSEQNSR